MSIYSGFLTRILPYACPEIVTRTVTNCKGLGTRFPYLVTLSFLLPRSVIMGNASYPNGRAAIQAPTPTDLEELFTCPIPTN